MSNKVNPVISSSRRLLSRQVALAVLACFSLLSLSPLSAVAAQNKPAVPLHSEQTAPAETIDSLRLRIASHISQPRFAAAQWGIKIISLDTGKLIFEHNPQKYFSPASNAKLYTAALALERLGPDYRIKTSLYSTSRPNASGTLKADLIVYGRGDPTMAARLNSGDYFKGLDALINQLVNAGVRRIEGDLVGDESYFAGPPFGSGWEWDDLQAYYGAESSALTVNDNAIDVFVKPAERIGMPCRITTGPMTSYVTFINRTQTAAKGSETAVTVYRPVGENHVFVTGRVPIDSPNGYYTALAVHNPAGLFVSTLKDAMAARGISVTGRTRMIDWKYREVTPINFDKLVELGSVDSMPLGEIIRETLKPSQNLYAQLLLLQVGARWGLGVGGQGLEKQGMRIGSQGLAKQGLGVGGQGLARDTANDGPPSNPQPPTPNPHPNPYSTTEEAGVASMNDFLETVGVKKGDVLLEEGSGLSRRDVITPQATVSLLSYINRSRWADIFRNALPIAGVDGTLQNRMKGTAAAGNVRAKTGSLRYVYTLSGYVTTAAGEHLAFSIMLNNYYNAERSAALRDPQAAGRPQPAPRDDLDAIAIMLAGFSGRSQ